MTVRTSYAQLQGMLAARQEEADRLANLPPRACGVLLRDNGGKVFYSLLQGLQCQIACCAWLDGVKLSR